MLWSAWRAYTIDDTLRGVMIETAKTTSMVFIILIGAAMLTSAFRGFGGEHLVKEFLTSLPGGFWTQFVVVMAVIFFLGFFLDFIEISVVVVPIVAPILLADPSANITAVWLGVMIGLNIQTSFLTPPFGFSLFYLRGVAPPVVKTTQIYKGALAFIVLQLVGLAIAGYFPGLVNYMPYRTYLTSETAPPPVNPRLQLCMERRVFAEYRDNRAPIAAGIERARTLDLSVLPADHRAALTDGIAAAGTTFELVEQVAAAESELDEFTQGYRPLHRQTRRIYGELRSIERKLEQAQLRHDRLRRNPAATRQQFARAEAEIAQLQRRKAELLDRIPAGWDEAKATFDRLLDADTRARQAYRRNVDAAYFALDEVRKLIRQGDSLAQIGTRLRGLDSRAAQAAAQIKQVESEFGDLDGVASIRMKLAQSRRALTGGNPDADRADQLLDEVIVLFDEELAWRAAAKSLLPALNAYNDAIKSTIGLRLQKRLTTEQAEDIAACQSAHRDISLHF